MVKLRLLLSLLFLVTFYLLPAHAQDEERTVGMPTQQNNLQETYRQLNLLGDVFERVRDQYVEEVTDEQLVKNAVDGMLTNLDPHSGYLLSLIHI